MEPTAGNNQILARTVLEAEIGSRIKSNRNYIGLVAGDTGSGKSWSSIRIAEMLSPSFTPDNIVFDTISFIRVLKRLTSQAGGKGQFIIYDEAGSDLSARRSMSETNVQMSAILEMLRFTLVNVLFTVPSVKQADINISRLAHGHIVAEAIDRARCPPDRKSVV